MATQKIRFVTDSTCDLPDELVEKWQIGVVPIFVNIGDASYADDGESLDRVDYYDRLPTLSPFPTTAAPSPGMVKECVDQLFEDADHIVILTAPASLSAIYDSMRLGSAHLPADRVTLIDSGTVTMALGYQVLIAAEVAAETGDLAQVLAAIQKVRDNLRFVAVLHTLDNLRRSGRINLAAAGIGTLLQVKPAITVIDGVVEVLARVRTDKRAQAELVERVRGCVPLDRLTLLHTNNPEGAAWLKEQVADILPDSVHIINATPALGTHSGAQALGFVGLRTDWRL
jgi:DegV family protein with EDD domain